MWITICSNNKLTGGKILSSKTKKSTNRLAGALRIAAQSLWTKNIDFNIKIESDVKEAKLLGDRQLRKIIRGQATKISFQLIDMNSASEVLKGRKVAPGVVLKIVPSTDELWNRCLDEGIIKIF